MEEIIVQAFSQLAFSVGQQLLREASKPENVEKIIQQFSALGCHDASDVAQDAIDAYRAGHLSKEAALSR